MVILSVSRHQPDHQFLEASAAACNGEVARAADLSGALGVLRRREIAVVVFDHDWMPGNWRDMLVYLQEQPNPAALIVTSRLADDRLWAEALNLGAWGVLAKPFDRTEVTRSIELAYQHWQSTLAARGENSAIAEGPLTRRTGLPSC
jgi:DNA-binding NarL/FixJ family response regulator